MESNRNFLLSTAFGSEQIRWIPSIFHNRAIVFHLVALE